MNERYFGIYCPQHNAWQTKMDGTLIYYPSKAIAETHANLERAVTYATHHLWIAEEFGKEVRVDAYLLPTGSEICPVVN